MNEELNEQTYSIRDELYSSIGTVDDDVIAHIINPSFMGGPSWPSLRQAFKVIRTNETILIASDGLSDPFDDSENPNNGFRVEIIAETKEDLGDDVADSWLFKLVHEVAQQAACSGQFYDFLIQHNVVTMELYGDGLGLDEFKNKNGMIGVMIGVESSYLPKHAAFPSEDILLATVQVLTTDELEYVSESRAEGRNNLHTLMKEKGLFNIISRTRPSLLKNDESFFSQCWTKFKHIFSKPR